MIRIVCHAASSSPLHIIGLSLREHSKPDRFRSTTGGISNGGDQAKYIKDLKNLYFNGEQF